METILWALSMTTETWYPQAHFLKVCISRVDERVGDAGVRWNNGCHAFLICGTHHQATTVWNPQVVCLFFVASNCIHEILLLTLTDNISVTTTLLPVKVKVYRETAFCLCWPQFLTQATVWRLLNAGQVLTFITSIHTHDIVQLCVHLGNDVMVTRGVILVTCVRHLA